VFSSGVHLATYSALLAARSINTCLGNHLSDEISFQEFEARYRREFDIFYDFLMAFYDLDQDFESYYWTARRLMKEENPGKDAFLNLVGGDASGELIARPRTESGVRKGIGELLFPAATGMTADMYAESGHHSSERQRFWTELNTEGFRLQLRGALDSAPAREHPLFKGGLVPSADGLRWAQATISSKGPGKIANRSRQSI
jgi:halogenation protein CepH